MAHGNTEGLLPTGDYNHCNLYIKEIKGRREGKREQKREKGEGRDGRKETLNGREWSRTLKGQVYSCKNLLWELERWLSG